jgi:uncharacterized membrane protein YeiB
VKRRWSYKPKRTDFLAFIGVIGFVIQMFRETSDPTLVYASLALLGLPFISRLDDRCNGHSNQDKKDSSSGSQKDHTQPPI